MQSREHCFMAFFILLMNKYIKSVCYYLGYDVKKIKHVRIREEQIAYGTKVPLRALHSGFEYEQVEIIRAGTDQHTECAIAHWEFIPFWIKNAEELIESRKKGIPTLNATAEKLLTSKLFKQAALQRRCILPVSWFFEWRHITHAGEKKPEKIPYCITSQDEDYLLFAGVWQPWTDQQTGETIDTFAIVTTEANEWMAQIHNSKKRMPLMLTETKAAEWISTGLKESDIQKILNTPCNDIPLTAWTIHKNFRSDADPTSREHYAQVTAIQPFS